MGQLLCPIPIPNIISGEEMILLLRESIYNQLVNFNGNRVIYNALTKSSIQITEDFDIQRLLKMKDSEVITTLEKIGIIVEDSPSEFETLQYLFLKKYFGSNDFLNIVLVPGLDCNFKCPYCFERVQETGENIFKTDLSTYFSTLRTFAESNFKKYNSVEISLFGGEPLLFEKDLFAFFQFIKEKLPEISFFSSIVTNGALLGEEMVYRLLAINCRSIQITIDGCKEIHNKNRIFKDGKETYDLLIKNINNCARILPDECQLNLRINLNNITPKEVETTLLDIEPLLRKKIKILFRPIYNTDCYKQNNSNKFYDLKPYYDMAINMGYNIVRNTYYYQACESCSSDNFFFIMPDLSIWKCINDINFTEARIGKINEDGIIQFEADKLINWYKYSNCFLDEGCRKCKMLPDCFGGCVLYRAKNGKRSCKEFEMAALPYLY